MKIQIDETGNFGREVNPMNSSDMKFSLAWTEFERTVKSYPLTSQQVPLSIVEGDLVNQYKISVHDVWIIGKTPDNANFGRRAYCIPKTIDGFAVGSEIVANKGSVEEMAENLYPYHIDYRKHFIAGYNAFANIIKSRIENHELELMQTRELRGL